MSECAQGCEGSRLRGHEGEPCRAVGKHQVLSPHDLREQGEVRVPPPAGMEAPSAGQAPTARHPRISTQRCAPRHLNLNQALHAHAPQPSAACPCTSTQRCGPTHLNQALHAQAAGGLGEVEQVLVGQHRGNEQDGVRAAAWGGAGTGFRHKTLMLPCLMEESGCWLGRVLVAAQGGPCFSTCAC